MSDRPSLKPVEWIGTTLHDLRVLPRAVRREMGYALWLAQAGEYAPQCKRMRGDLSGLIEIVEGHDGNAYRAVYTARMRGVIYVLHVFQKKSTHGIATPRRVLDLIRERYARAREHFAEHYGHGDL